jgi:hypothetical protein
LSLQLIAERTRLIKDQILLEGRKGALIKLIGESSLEAEKALNKLTTKPDFFSFEELAIGLRAIFEGTDAAGARIRVLTKDFSNSSKTTETYSSALDDVNKQLTITDAKIKSLIDQQKKLDEQDKKAPGIAKKLAAEKEKAIKLQEEQTRVDNLYNAKNKIRQQAELNKTELEGLRAITKERRKGERESGITTPTQISGIVPSFNNEKFLSSVRAANNELARLKEQANLQATYDLINNTFFSPISTLFEEFLDTGKFTFSEFGKAVLKAINQIVSKIIATGIVSLLFTIFSGGFSAASGGAAGGFQKVLGLITSSLGFNIGKGGGGGQPNLANLSGGGMQLAGEVVFMQRGSDLVGVLNRTNGTINRVG